MRRFRDVLMDVFNFAKVMIALVVLISIGIVILAIYQVGNAMEDTYHTPAVVVQTAPAPIGAPAPVAAPAAVPLAAPTPTVAVDSKPAPVQEKSPVSIVVKHIGRGSNQFMPDSYVSLVVMLKNDGKKAIKATKGAVVVYDVFGEQLLRLGIENAKTIRPGETVKETGEWSIMSEPKAQNAINGESADTSKLTFAFIPKVILFEDGSKFEQ
jgi:hypothetical protein